MSTRNFARVFRRDVKLTPAGFVDAARIDAARRMLADTKFPLQRIARTCGFGNLNTMRRVFIRNLGVAPLDYRKSFRSAYADGGGAMPPAPRDERDRPAQAAPARNEGPAPERGHGALSTSPAPLRAYAPPLRRSARAVTQGGMRDRESDDRKEKSGAASAAALREAVRRDKRGGPAKPRGAPWRHPPRSDDTVVLYGWHTVMAALANPQRRFRRLLATENAARRLAEEKLSPGVKLEMVRPDAIDALVGPEAVHQGLYAETDPLPSPALEEVASGVLLVLDQITDPHNVGAILRSAAAFAVTAVVTTARHSPEATGVLAKAASGALEYVPIVTVGNLAQALRTLKDLGTLLVGLDSSGEADLAKVTFAAPVALVLGAEGKGLRQLTRTNCDVVARLDLPGAIKSLNVSNATALALYIATSRLAQG